MEILVPQLNSFISYENIISIFEEQEKTLTSNYFYYSIKTSISSFLDPTFINNYIKSGQFFAISNPKYNFIDRGNSFAIIPKGNLIMLIDRDTYQQLGIQGKKSFFNKKSSSISTKFS